MDRLHWGSLSETVEVDISEMELEMVRYVDRSLVSWAAARRAVLVLRHQEYNDDVHVHTFYLLSILSRIIIIKIRNI